MKYHKTDAGQQALKERSHQISARQRSALIMFDGKKTVHEVLSATTGLGIVPADVEHLLSLGFLALTDAGGGGAAVPAPPATTAAAAAWAVLAASPALAPLTTPSQRYSQAYPMATQLTATLGLRGFRLNLAVEAAAGYDDLVALLPKLTEALGVDKTRELRRVLGM